MSRYARDPRWLITRWPAKDGAGNFIPKGTRVFYYPATKAMLTGDAAEQAARDFAAAANDESFMNGGA